MSNRSTLSLKSGIYIFHIQRFTKDSEQVFLSLLPFSLPLQLSQASSGVTKSSDPSLSLHLFAESADDLRNPKKNLNGSLSLGASSSNCRNFLWVFHGNMGNISYFTNLN